MTHIWMDIRVFPLTILLLFTTVAIRSDRMMHCTVAEHRNSHEDVWGSRGIAPYILNLGIRWRWSASRPGRFIFGTHWVGGWVGPIAGLDAVTKRGSPCPCQETNPGRPARSLVSLLRYKNGYSRLAATPATKRRGTL
jgi:hypothetical protein